MEGTYLDKKTWDLMTPGIRVGRTVLRLTRLTDIHSPGPARRAVFVDQGCRPGPSNFYVHYLDRKWNARTSPPPIPHTNGMTLSMADGHVEYWKWKGRETVEISALFNMDFTPETKDGLADIERLQRATWGRLGFRDERGL